MVVLPRVVTVPVSARRHSISSMRNRFLDDARGRFMSRSEARLGSRYCSYDPRIRIQVIVHPGAIVYIMFRPVRVASLRFPVALLLSYQESSSIRLNGNHPLCHPPW